MKKLIHIKRVYEQPLDSDGYRILVDRIWPRGLRKQEAKLDEWDRDLAPSTALRKWFGHEATRFDEFARRYAQELQQQRPGLERLRELARKKRICLLYAARDEQHNQAVILRDLLLRSD